MRVCSLCTRGAVGAAAELNGTRMVKMRLNNSVLEVEVGETVDGSANASTPPGVRVASYLSARIGSGADGTGGVRQPLRRVRKYA